MNRRVAWTGLLLVAGLAALAVARWLDDPEPAGVREGPAGVRGEAEDPAADEGARLAGTPAVPAAPAVAGNAADPRSGDAADRLVIRLRGVVVDGEDQPQAGAAVRLEVRQRTADAGSTDAEGRFALRVDLPPGAGPLYGLLAARGGAGVALRSIVLLPDPRWRNPVVRTRQDLGRIALRLAEPFDVRLVSTCEGAPPARLRFRHGAFHGGPDHLLLETDADGRAHVDGLHAGSWRVVAVAEGCGRGDAFFRLPRTDAAPVEVTIGPPRTVTVEVVDGETGEAVEGAVLAVRERIRRPDGTACVDYVPALVVPPTDANGRSTIHGLGEDDVLWIQAAAQGYPTPTNRRLRDGPGYALVPEGVTEVRIELVAARTVSWPIEDGEVPAPENGTVLRLRPKAGSGVQTVPPTGRVEQGRVVVTGWAAGYAVAVAETPDGALAGLQASPGETEGPAVSFVRPRTVEVRLVYADGEPAVGFEVVVANLGNNPLHDPVPTDAEGVARIEGLFADTFGRVDVQVRTGPGLGAGGAIGTLDLSTGDGRLEATVQRMRDVVLHVRLDGEPGLPKSFLVRIGGDYFRGEDLTRDEERATLGFTWRPAGSGDTTFLELRAPGYLTATTRVDVPAAPAPVEATLDLVRGGLIVAEITRPTGGFHRVQLQTWDAEADRWELAFRGMLGVRPPNQADDQGEVRYPPVRPGRYRVVESALGIASLPVQVVAGDEPARVRLDLSGVVMVSGRVEVPEGTPLEGIRIRAEGIEEPLASNRMEGQPRTRWISTASHEGGIFELRVPGGRPVTLVPYAPFLRPAAKGGRVEVRGARDDVVLRLEQAPVATFTYDREPKFQMNPGKPRPIAVLLYDGEPQGEPAHRLSAWLDGSEARLAGWVPGTWTVWINAMPFAPVVLRGVVLADEDLDLGTIETSDGSSFVAKLVVEEGKEPPRYSAYVVHEEEPRYSRSTTMWGGQGEVRVRGIGPGRFRVHVIPRPVGPRLNEVIEFDGRTDVERTLGP